MHKFRLCCAQAAFFWGQAVYSFRHACAGNDQLHTDPYVRTAYAVRNWSFGRIVSPYYNQTLSYAYRSNLTEVIANLYPLYTPPITTTTKYINI